MGTINHYKENRCVEITEADYARENVPDYEPYNAGYGRGRDIVGRIDTPEAIYHDIVVRRGYYEGASIDFVKKTDENAYSVEDEISYGQEMDPWDNRFIKQVAEVHKVDTLPLLEIAQSVPKPEYIPVDFGDDELADSEKLPSKARQDAYNEAWETVIEKMDDYLEHREAKKINGLIDKIRDEHGYAEIEPGWATGIKKARLAAENEEYPTEGRYEIHNVGWHKDCTRDDVWVASTDDIHEAKEILKAEISRLRRDSTTENGMLLSTRIIDTDSANLVLTDGFTWPGEGKKQEQIIKDLEDIVKSTQQDRWADKTGREIQISVDPIMSVLTVKAKEGAVEYRHILERTSAVDNLNQAVAVFEAKANELDNKNGLDDCKGHATNIHR